MMFHLFFLTVTISKRKYTADEIKSVQLQNQLEKEIMHKRAQHMSVGRMM
ncbi:YrzI family small protein [Evansella cellulosilytica]|uniref:YrzI family small protein n=1 Tax=Evansella cellulosilytica (strain ATCC 21833 / DSM 2522 / FERM P-1141 / JCM 9156 / N-4) TaxID=649639 RepID=E6TYT2_EVAC2|nr:YrzI family small protein [Evansella cellulosilytica]ADU31267.1 Conserved hypothetical protein CHP02413, YrzI [Evansella cellulosilytica DSM 2522]